MARHQILVLSTIIVALVGGGAWYELERADPRTLGRPKVLREDGEVEIAVRAIGRAVSNRS